MSQEDLVPQTVNVRWPVESYPQVANQFALVEGPGLTDGRPDGTVYLFVGNLVPPLTASPDEFRSVVETIGGSIPINNVGTFSLSVTRLRELRDLITSHLDSVDQRDR